jgi:hypothetical protein
MFYKDKNTDFMQSILLYQFFRFTSFLYLLSLFTIIKFKLFTQKFYIICSKKNYPDHRYNISFKTYISSCNIDNKKSIFYNFFFFKKIPWSLIFKKKDKVNKLVVNKQLHSHKIKTSTNNIRQIPLDLWIFEKTSTSLFDIISYLWRKTLYRLLKNRKLYNLIFNKIVNFIKNIGTNKELSFIY